MISSSLFKPSPSGSDSPDEVKFPNCWFSYQSGIPSKSVSADLSKYFAKYFDKSADTDLDGIPDWYENQQFGNLTSSGESDPDGDGLNNDEEIKFGLSPLIKDQFLEGGIAIPPSRN